MRTVFADTFYFLALLDSREASHAQASQFSRDAEVQIVTTEWVLAEFGNAYSDPRDRADFVKSLPNPDRASTRQNHSCSNEPFSKWN
jgi:predicted nucleic acid-binding protein